MSIQFARSVPQNVRFRRDNELVQLAHGDIVQRAGFLILQVVRLSGCERPASELISLSGRPQHPHLKFGGFLPWRITERSQLYPATPRHTRSSEKCEVLHRSVVVILASQSASEAHPHIMNIHDHQHGLLCTPTLEFLSRSGYG